MSTLLEKSSVHQDHTSRCTFPLPTALPPLCLSLFFREKEILSLRHQLCSPPPVLLVSRSRSSLQFLSWLSPSAHLQPSLSTARVLGKALSYLTSLAHCSLFTPCCGLTSTRCSGALSLHMHETLLTLPSLLASLISLFLSLPFWSPCVPWAFMWTPVEFHLTSLPCALLHCVTQASVLSSLSWMDTWQVPLSAVTCSGTHTFFHPFLILLQKKPSVSRLLTGFLIYSRPTLV